MARQQDLPVIAQNIYNFLQQHPGQKFHSWHLSQALHIGWSDVGQGYAYLREHNPAIPALSGPWGYWLSIDMQEIRWFYRWRMHTAITVMRRLHLGVIRPATAQGLVNPVVEASVASTITVLEAAVAQI